LNHKAADLFQDAMQVPAQTLALLADRRVIAGLMQAKFESDMGGSNPVEQGGFILKDPQTDQLSIARWPPGLGNQIQPVISSDGTYQGKEIVGSFHTHPNVGPGWKQEPRRSDIRFVQQHPHTAGPDHFVISVEVVYHIDGDGNVVEIGRTAELLQ
jgi:hypothetical protein